MPYEYKLTSSLPIQLVRREIVFNGTPLVFFHPQNDDTIYGTLSCLQNDRFHIKEVPFLDGDVVVDIGCNIGLVSLVIARLAPGAQIHCFDASPLAVRCLQLAIAENKLTNVRAYHLAVSSSRARNVTFYSNGKDLSCLVAEGLNTSNPVYDSGVNQIAIDDIFDSPLIDADKVKYLKMDIEGGEFAIFDRLFKVRPDILDRIQYLHLEIHPFKEYDPVGLQERVVQKFDKRVFFDT